MNFLRILGAATLVVVGAAGLLRLVPSARPPPRPKPGTIAENWADTLVALGQGNCLVPPKGGIDHN